MNLADNFEPHGDSRGSDNENQGYRSSTNPANAVFGSVLYNDANNLLVKTKP